MIATICHFYASGKVYFALRKYGNGELI